MNRNVWIDGFNLLHHWPATAPLFRRDSGTDIVRAVGLGLAVLARRLGGKGGNCVVYLDGGLAARSARVSGLSVRYAGPGGKADDVMADDLLAENGGGGGFRPTAVTNDRELAARLRALGASVVGVREFFAGLDGKDRKGGPGGRAGKGGSRPQAERFPGRGDDAAVMREKCRRPTAVEVRAWLEVFDCKTGEEG